MRITFKYPKPDPIIRGIKEQHNRSNHLLSETQMYKINDKHDYMIVLAVCLPPVVVPPLPLSSVATTPHCKGVE